MSLADAFEDVIVEFDLAKNPFIQQGCDTLNVQLTTTLINKAGEPVVYEGRCKGVSPGLSRVVGTDDQGNRVLEPIPDTGFFVMETGPDKFEIVFLRHVVSGAGVPIV